MPYLNIGAGSNVHFKNGKGLIKNFIVKCNNEVKMTITNLINSSLLQSDNNQGSNALDESFSKSNCGLSAKL